MTPDLQICGVTGILDLSFEGGGRTLLESVSGMCQALHDRRPDGDGNGTDVEAGIALGHQRLAIFDLSSAGRQPMPSSCDRFVISYKGEIYNFVELRDEIEARGRSFTTSGDTEVVFTDWREW